MCIRDRYDTDGLTLLVRPSGTKVWQYRYKFADKSNIYTIGRYPQVEAKEARAALIEIKSLLARGVNPNQRKESTKQENVETAKNTFKAIAEDWYSKQSWAPKHAKNIKSRLEKDVYPVIGHKPITEISIKDILSVLRKIEERGALDVAKRINQYCTQIFDYAILQELCETNPALGRGKFIKRPKGKNRPHLKEAELPEFLKALAETELTKMNLAVRFLLLTFVRPGELIQAQWSQIDIDKALWCIPDEQMKKDREHLVPLSSQALEVLKQLKPMTGNDKYLFPGSRKNKPYAGETLLKAVKKLTDDKSVSHGFRHTASTILNENGFPPDHIEMQLSHVEENKVRGTYNLSLIHI